MIERFAAEGAHPAAVSVAAGRLLERQEAARKRARSDFAGAWRRLDRRKRRRWM
jgi:hypothetical protein